MKEEVKSDVKPYMFEKSLERGLGRCVLRCEKTPNALFGSESECLRQCGAAEVASFVAVDQFMETLFVSRLY